MRLTEAADEAETLLGMPKKKLLLGCAFTVVLGIGAGIGGLVCTAAHKFTETVALKKTEAWLAGGEDSGRTPHEKLIGDWCMLDKDKSGIRGLMDCYDTVDSCAQAVRFWSRHFTTPLDLDCQVIPADTMLWCSTEALVPSKDKLDGSPWGCCDTSTLCYFDNSSCDRKEHLCFPTTKAALAN
jgi:hypothetical protein